MSHSDKSQGVASPAKNRVKNSQSKENTVIQPRFSFGLSRRPTQAEYIMIAKYIAFILMGSAIYRMEVFHTLLTSKTAEYVGTSIVVITGLLFLRALDKRGLLKDKYERNNSSGGMGDGET